MQIAGTFGGLISGQREQGRAHRMLVHSQLFTHLVGRAQQSGGAAEEGLWRRGKQEGAMVGSDSDCICATHTAGSMPPTEASTIQDHTVKRCAPATQAACTHNPHWFEAHAQHSKQHAHTCMPVAYTTPGYSCKQASMPRHWQLITNQPSLKQLACMPVAYTTQWRSPCLMVEPAQEEDPTTDQHTHRKKRYQYSLKQLKRNARHHERVRGSASRHLGSSNSG